MTAYPKLRSIIIFRMCAISADKLHFRGDSELCQTVYLISPTLRICLDQAESYRAIYTRCEWHTVERHLNNAESGETQCRESWLVQLESAVSECKLKLVNCGGYQAVLRESHKYPCIASPTYMQYYAIVHCLGHPSIVLLK